MLPALAGLATRGSRCCCRRRRRLLPEAEAVAASGGRPCYKERPDMLQGAGGVTTKVRRGCFERRRQAAVLPAKEAMVLMAGGSAISPCRRCCELRQCYCSGDATASGGGGSTANNGGDATSIDGGAGFFQSIFTTSCSPCKLLAHVDGGVHPRGVVEKRFLLMYIERTQGRG